MNILDSLQFKEELFQRTLDIEIESYNKLVDLSSNYFDASVSKIINYCIMDFSQKERVTMYEVGELEKHTVILRKSTISTLNELKRKFNIPMYVLINIAIKEGISILENRL